jgi:hypothetical protein
LNPYQGFDHAEPVVGAVLPSPGTYDFVFDTPTGKRPGKFRFRFWVSDTTPPSIRLLARTTRLGRPIRFAVHDSGSGVDPSSIQVRVNGRPVRWGYSRGVLRLWTTRLRPGRDTVSVTAADYQETKNMEDIRPVLPNTRVVHTTVILRRR